MKQLKPNQKHSSAKLQNKFQQQSAKIMDIRLKGQTSQEDLKLHRFTEQLNKATLEKFQLSLK